MLLSFSSLGFRVHIQEYVGGTVVQSAACCTWEPVHKSFGCLLKYRLVVYHLHLQDMGFPENGALGFGFRVGCRTPRVSRGKQISLMFGEEVPSTLIRRPNSETKRSKLTSKARSPKSLHLKP